MEVKFEQNVLNQLKARKVAFDSLQVTAQILQREFKLYLDEEFNKLGLDLSKQYDVNPETGVISEVKKEVIIKEELKTE